MYFPRSRTSPLSSQRGFGLVELIVVVAILAVLVVVAIPVFGAIQTKAKDEVVKNELASFAQTIEVVKANEGAGGKYLSTLDGTRRFAFTPTAYGQDEQKANLRYCYNAATDSYIMYAVSVTGNYFSVSSGGAVKPDTAVFGYGICAKIGLSTTNPISNGINNNIASPLAPWLVVR
jgi:prepilin-type N-terminal cleavage/methylation domain-containing protein